MKTQPWGESVFSFSVGLPLEPNRVLGYIVGNDFDFNSPHKVDAYNLLMWYTMVIKAGKHYSWQRNPGPTLMCGFCGYVEHKQQEKKTI